MAAIWLLTVKNIKLLLRAKWSALIVIFAPLLLILLLGLSYNTSDNFGIIVGVYAPQFTEETNAFTDLLRTEQFTIREYHEDVQKCVDDIKGGTVHTCISLPEQLHVQDNTQKEIVFYVDPSRINLVWMVQETVKSKFNIKAQEITQELTQDILSKISETQSQLSAQEANLGTAKEKASTAGQSTSTIVQDLKTIDFQIPERSANFSGNISEAGSDLTERLTNTKEKLTDASTAVKKAGLEEAEEEEIIKAIAGGINTISSLLDSGAGELLISLQKDLTVVTDKLSTASSVVSSSTGTLTASAADLEQVSASLESAKSAVSEMQAKLGSLKVTDAQTITSPLVTKIEKVSGEKTYLNYLFPALLVLVIMFSTLLLGTTLVLLEKHSPAFLRNFFVPVSKFTFITSTYVTNIILIITQIIVILGISLFFIDDALGSLASVALILFIGASVFTFIGMIIGYLFTSEETATLASISIGSVFLLFSGIILPLEAVPPFIRGIAGFNPFVLTEKLVREVFLFGTPLSQNLLDLGILAGYAVVLFIAIWIMESVLHKHLVQRFMHRHHVFHRQREKQLKNI
ncbi:ABC transporter permease [Candidatus Woesearchaeota archaeon]|nr:ABC transporter permease [Candidatus Woesearchaeota archaeon]